MYDIVLFNAQDMSDDQDGSWQTSLGMGAVKIASVLRKHGYTVLVVHWLGMFSYDECVELINLTITDQTKLIGFSTTFARMVEEQEDGTIKSLNIGLTESVFPRGKEFEEKCISLIKERSKDVKIAVGGSQVTASYKNTIVDYALLGYAEGSMLNLANHIFKAEALVNCHVNEYGITILDDRLGNTYDFNNDQMIWEELDIVNHKVLPIEFARGCIFKCSFCSFPLKGKKQLDYIKDPELIYNELMDNYTRFGITHYFIVDDTFNDNVDKLKIICEVIQRLPFQPKFWCFARLDLITVKPETLDLLYQIGVRSMAFGIETLNDDAGKAVLKGYSRQKQVEMIHHIRKTYPDISMHGYFIYGLPKESLSDLQETTRRLTDGEIGLHSWSIRPLFLYEDITTPLTDGSDLNTNHEKWGYRNKGWLTNGAGSIMNWENDLMNFFQAGAETQQAMQRAINSNNFYVGGKQAFCLVDLGYEVEKMIQVPHREINWDEIREQGKELTQTYKDTLFSLLKN